MKKILSVLLILAMLLSLVSVSAVAEGEKELLTIDCTMMPRTTTASRAAGLPRS